MEDKDKSYIKIKFIQIILIPFVLLLLWFIGSFMFSSKYNGSYTVISYNHDITVFSHIPENRITKNQKVTGEFEAKENNLGIVAMRFKQQPRIPWKQEDILIFRIKEKGAKEWYYQNEYYSGLTFDVPNLPIGFPIIPDSKGKNYQFEFESTRGNTINGLILSDREPVFSSRYQMDKAELLADSSLLIHFFLMKILNTFDTPDILFSSFVYLFPFLLYVAWITGIFKRALRPLSKRYEKGDLYSWTKKIYKNNTTFAFSSAVILITSVMYDIFILQILNDMVYLVIIFLWISIQRLVKASSIITFVLAILLICLSAILNELNNIGSAEKAAAWAFMFLVGGVFMEMMQLRKAKK